MQKKFKVISRGSVPIRLTWPTTMKSDGTKKFMMTGSVDCCNVLPEKQFVRTSLPHGHNTGFIRIGPFPLIGAA